MMAVADQDHAPLERWAGMRAAETTVVWDAHLGGYPVCLIGIESRPVPRFGFVPADGPDQWSAGTLFPQSSKKVARAINAASNNRPLVVLANLSGFDGSPESMRRLQLEYGAEIGRAVVNFKGPIVFCVISRYHGGAYVVFSRALNEQIEVAALEGTYASVIGGAPAAAVVFAGEVEARAKKDPRLQALTQAIAKAEGAERARLRTQWEDLFKVVHSEKVGEMAAEFDRVHSVQRALEVGALDRILPPADLRPYLIDAVRRGIAKEEESTLREAGREGRLRNEVVRMRVYWVEQTDKDVPADDNWLCPNEVACLKKLRFAKRRADWRLGRWTAKRAVCRLSRLATVSPNTCEDRNSRHFFRRTGSHHRRSRNAPGDFSQPSGRHCHVHRVRGAESCWDVIWKSIEPRSHDFVVDYFTAEEQSWVARTPSAERPEIVTLLWSAKESALKALQQGLRLDTRSVMVTPMAGAPDLDGWSPLRIGCVDGRVFQGWWRTADGVVRTVATDSTAGSPIHLALPETPFHAAQALDLGVRSANETRPVPGDRLIGHVCRPRTNSISTLS